MQESNDFLFESHRSVEDPWKDNYARRGALGNFASSRYRMVFFGALIVIPYILIIVLFALVSSNNGTKNYYDLSTTIKGSLQTSLAAGTPVSISSSGSVQTGGGTSIYLDIASLLQTSPSDLTINPIFTSAYLVTSTEHKTNTTTFTVVVASGPSPSQVTTKYSVTKPYAIASVQTMSQNSGVFIATSEDLSTDYNSSVIRIGVVDNISYTITFGPAATYDDNVQYSPTPMISRMSDSQFALCYYSGTAAMTRVGSIIGGTLDIVLSNAVPFADNSNYDIVFGVVGLSDSMYLTFHYTAKSVDTIPVAYVGTLNSTIIFVNSSDSDSAIVSLGRWFSSDALEVSGFVYGTRINDNTAVVAFSDFSTDGGITCVAVTVSNELGSSSSYSSSSSISSSSSVTPSANYSVNFGSTWQVTIGQSQLITSQGLMDIDIVTLSTDGQFMVMFSDLSNFGAMTVVTGKLYSNAQLERTSPNYVVSSRNSNSNSNFFWGALACGTTDPNNIQAAIIYALTDYQGATSAQFSLYMKLPSPIGVVGAYSKPSSGTGNVIFGGVAADYSNLIPGKAYYATTQGNVVTSGVYYGQSMAIPYAQVKVNNVNTIIGSDAQLGVAISSNSLNVKVQGQ